MTIPFGTTWHGFTVPHGSRFRGPPYDPGRSDFPSPVLTLAFFRRPSQLGRGLSAGSHTPRPGLVYLRARPVPRTNRCPALCPVVAAGWDRQVPRAPLPGPRCYLGRRRVQHAFDRRYPVFFAHTGSCVRPHPLPPISAHRTLMRRVFAGCCQPLLGGGPSRRYLRESFPGCSDHFPRWIRAVPVLVSSRATSAFPAWSRQVGFHDDSAKRLRAVLHFGAVVIPIVRASRFAWHPSRPYRCIYRAVVPSTSEQNVCRCLHTHRTC